MTTRDPLNDPVDITYLPVQHRTRRNGFIDEMERKKIKTMGDLVINFNKNIESYREACERTTGFISTFYYLRDYAEAIKHNRKRYKLNDPVNFDMFALMDKYRDESAVTSYTLMHNVDTSTDDFVDE